MQDILSVSAGSMESSRDLQIFKEESEALYAELPDTKVTKFCWKLVSELFVSFRA